MSGVRVLVGTHKGAFVMTSDAKRKQWDISGPHFTGWDIYHVKGSPVDPNRAQLGARRRWDVPAYHPPRQEPSRSDVHRHFLRGCFQDRGCRQELATGEQGPAFGGDP